MNLAITLAALLALPGFRGGVLTLHEAPSRLVQEASATGQNSPQPANDQAGGSADAKPSQGEAGKEAPPEKAEESSAPKTPAERSPGAQKHRPRKKKALPQPAEGEPRKVVIHHGGASESTAQILPGIAPEEANRQRQSSEQLLEASELSLKKLAGRSLDPTQQEMVVQTRQYMEGARSALKDSDTQRAHTLALKAYLLADDLAKHEK